MVNTPFHVDRYPYDKYTILLGATRALAHLGTHFTHRVFGLSAGMNIVFAKMGFLPQMLQWSHIDLHLGFKTTLQCNLNVYI